VLKETQISLRQMLVLLNYLRVKYVYTRIQRDRVYKKYFPHNFILRVENMSNKDIVEFKKHIARLAVLVKRFEGASAAAPKRGKKGVKKAKSKTPAEVLKPQVPKQRKVAMCKKCNVPRKGHKCTDEKAKVDNIEESKVAQE
jgi:RNase P subunit RPR2